MKGLIVDCWNPTGGRVEQLKRALAQYAVEHVAQVSAEAEDEWDAAADDVRELLASFDFVLLHVGDDQKFKLKLLDEICQSRPVFCYTGGSVPADIEAHCQTPGLHVLCSGMFGRSDAGALPNAAVRWLRALGSNPAENGLAAWQEVRKIDPAMHKKIQEFETRLSTLLKEHHWTPEAGISPALREALQGWRNEPGAKC
jgi:predicted component of type VI protein secretion system